MKFLVFLCVSAATAFTVPTPQAPLRTLATALFAENGGNAAAGKKILVLGGDGFCGWPTALYLSDQGHDVVVVDNLSRRNIDIELGCDSLTPIQSMEVRRCYCLGLCGVLCGWLTGTMPCFCWWSSWHALGKTTGSPVYRFYPALSLLFLCDEPQQQQQQQQQYNRHDVKLGRKSRARR
jgi:hypothetical protein